jgi:hypothetical protein
LNLQTYTLFLEKLGGKLIWYNEIPFYSYRPGFLWSVPQFASYEILPKNLKQKQVKFWISHGSEYNLKHLHPRTRTKIRRGLERCEIHQLNWEQLRIEGLSINIDALRRQKRRSGCLDNPKWWGRQCRISAQFTDVRAWGAFVEGNLASYISVNIHDDILMNGIPKRIANVVHAMSYSKYIERNSKYGKSYPNEALLYYVTKVLLDQEQCASVIHGFQSSNPNLELWKRHMGYKEKPLIQNVVINPILYLARPFVPKLKNLFQDKNKS